MSKDNLISSPARPRRVPEEFSVGSDRHNAQKAWLDGYDAALRAEVSSAQGKLMINESTIFPLTADEAKLLYDELRTHTFYREHPMYHYHSSLLDRMRSFIENNQDKLRICK